MGIGIGNVDVDVAVVRYGTVWYGVFSKRRGEESVSQATYLINN
jgi:hypothetical protein